METGGNGDEAFGNKPLDSKREERFSEKRPNFSQQIMLRLIQDVGEVERNRIINDIKQGMEEARKRRETKLAEQKRREEIGAQHQEYLRQVQREQEEAERKRRREAQMAKNKGKGLER